MVLASANMLLLYGPVIHAFNDLTVRLNGV